MAISAFVSDGSRWLDVESAHSCEKSCAAMKTPQSCAGSHQGLGEFRGRALTCCACILRQTTVSKGGKLMAVRRGKAGSRSHLQLSCEIWHGCGPASEKRQESSAMKTE